MCMERSAAAFARAALLPLSLLCFPVSRGSPLLRMVGVPFQCAVRYHRWLGHLTLALYSAHSVLFICVFVTEHNAPKVCRVSSKSTFCCFLISCTLQRKLSLLVNTILIAI